LKNTAYDKLTVNIFVAVMHGDEHGAFHTDTFDLYQAKARQGFVKMAAVELSVFPSSRGGVLSADAVQALVARHVATASRKCSALAGRSITPHPLRHTTAMALLRRGVDQTVIALWLGHESAETTRIYLHADIGLKERALGHSDPSGVQPVRFRPPDPLLAFLKSL
jgi:site-specific recombinase XerD